VCAIHKSSCFSRCCVPIAIPEVYEQIPWIPQNFLLTNPDLHHGLIGHHFLLRELEILLASGPSHAVESNFVGLHRGQNGVFAKQGKTVDEIGDIAALDETLRQSDRFLVDT
jgi:hypothetical protein